MIKTNRSSRALRWCGLVVAVLLTSGSAAQGQSTAEVADRYMALYQAGDVDGVAAFYTAESVMEDPTAIARAAGVRLVGVGEIAGSLEQAFAAVTDFRLDIERRFTTGPYAVLTGVVSYSIPGAAVGDDRDTVRLEADFTLILEVREGMVVRHTDYVNYDGMVPGM